MPTSQQQPSKRKSDQREQTQHTPEQRRSKQHKPARQTTSKRKPNQQRQSRRGSSQQEDVRPRAQEGPQKRKALEAQAQQPKAQRDKRPQSGARPSRRRKPTPEQQERARTLAKYRGVGVTSSAIILTCGAIVGLLFFARPTTSEVERRALTELPAFSLQSFADGSYFSDLALWYSDTYPIREQLVSADQTLDGLHGIRTETQMVGGTKQADELPPLEDANPADGDSDGTGTSAQDKDESSKTVNKTEKKKREPVEVPAAEVMAEAIQDQITDGLYVKGDTAYNIYYFSQEAVQDYADAINATAEELKGYAQVYSLIAPNSSGIMLTDQEVKDLGGTNQVDAIDYFYSLYSDDVRSINPVPGLKAHTDDYIYFRTDHHWTALGAYYAYLAFCEEKGVEPEDYNDMKHENFGDFLGSFYSQLSSDQMAANPDYVEAWVPNGTNTMTLYDTDGSAEEYNVITDTSNWDVLGKTMAFIMGDQPLEKIENPTKTDGSSCLVIKDSFGDFFVPWLVDSYQTVWVADFRYFEGNIKDFVMEHNVNDLIIESNISLAGGGVYAPAILGRL